MKITVYCDREGILRYNPEGWPEKPSDPGEWAHQEFHREYYEEKAKWRKDIEKAKSESVPFEDQGHAKFAILMCNIYVHGESEINPDSFYEVEIEGEIGIVFLTELDSGKLKDIGCKVTGLGSRGYTNRYARIVKKGEDYNNLRRVINI